MTQAQALDILKMGKNVFVTGPAGSGKTHVVNEYIKYLKSHKVDIGITASTGIAATHMGGMTIHAWTGMGIKASMSEIDLEGLAEKPYLSRRFANAKVLIIDEVSMLHHFRFDMIDRITRRMKKVDEPFGGMQVVLVGDFFQLPPIARMGEAAAQFIYTSDAWREGKFTICYLSEQFRQKDDVSLSILNEIRSGEVSDEAREHLRARHIDVLTKIREELVEADDATAKELKEIILDIEPTRLFTHNADVDMVNSVELGKIKNDEFEYFMTSKGKSHIVDSLKKSCLAPEVLRLRKGARVMCVKNNFEAGYVNGTLGVVVSCGPGVAPVIRTSGISVGGNEGGTGSGLKTITIEPATWKIEEDGRPLAEITQYPLRLAWAITVHKSQGMSLDAIEVDLSKSFTPGMGYVALSRVRTLAGLTVLGINEMAFKVHNEVLEFDYELREKSLEAQDELEILIEDSARNPTARGTIGQLQAEFLASVAPMHRMEGSSGEKISTYEQTAALVLRKKSLDEIAKGRDLVVDTVIDHIEKCIQGGDLELTDIQYLKKKISYAHFKKIEIALSEVAETTDKPPLLSSIKSKVGASISFKEIRLTRVLLGYIKVSQPQ
ncbi:MAG: AAA family ATPase [bacterium]